MADKWTAADIPDQHGRVGVVTGANSGIGFFAARAGARVVLAVRNSHRWVVFRKTRLALIARSSA